METVTEAKLESLDALIGTSSGIAVVVHTHPDGDAAGSGAALLEYLTRHRGKSAKLMFPDALPDNLGFILGECPTLVGSTMEEECREWLGSCDLLFCLDHNSVGRTGSLETPVKEFGGHKVLIDHHLNPETEAFTLAFSDVEVSSTCELLFRILSAMPEFKGKQLPVAIGTPLLAGMTTDTNNFANSVYPGTLEMASALLASGVDRDAVLQKLYNGYGENRFRAMGSFLSEKMHILPEGAAYAVFDSDTIKRYGLLDGDTEGFVNLPLGIGKVWLSIFLKQDDGYFRVSTRSKKGVSAADFAGTYFHGGGHECAAGGRLYFPEDIPAPENAEEYVKQAAARFMQEHAPAQK